MSTLFGGNENRNVRDIVNTLTESTGAICGEMNYPTSLQEAEIANMQESIQSTMHDFYSGALGISRGDYMESFLAEDAAQAGELFVNNIREMTRMNLISEGAVPDLRTLTASIATNMRIPYEAVLHRLYNTRTADRWNVEMEDVEPTIAAPGYDEELLIDAFSPRAKVKFIDKTEIPIDVLVKGVVPGKACKKLFLTPGLDPLLKVDRDARISSIEVQYADGTAVPASKIRPRRGITPFFEPKNERLNMEFDIELQNGEIETVQIDAKLDFDKNILEYLNASESDHVQVTLVKFYANASHEEHLRPITTGAKNNFRNFIIPTRPHIEVSMPEETRTDIKNGIHHFSNTDIITYLTEQIARISASMEDERLEKALKQEHLWEAEFSFEAPNNFAYGNLEWFKREFMPFLDSVALVMKDTYNITDCHFRALVSPYLLRILDAEYSMDKSANEGSKGSGPINYSIGVKTSTCVFYLISSQRQTDPGKMTLLLQPNQFKTAPVRTYDYYRYSSFLTDKIRRSDNTRFEAIVYAERNLPVVFTPVATELNVTDMYIMNRSGKRSFRKVGDIVDAIHP